MSAEENKQLMTAIFTKVAEGDGSLFVEHLADNVTMQVTGQYSWSQTFQGKESLLRDLYGYLNNITQSPRKTTPFNIVAGDDYVIVEAKGEMLTKDGKPYNNDYCLVYRLEKKKIVEIREYQDSYHCEKVLGSYPCPCTQLEA